MMLYMKNRIVHDKVLVFSTPKYLKDFNVFIDDINKNN